MGLSFIGGLRPQLPKDRAHENNIVYHLYQKYSFRLSFPWKECDSNPKAYGLLKILIYGLLKIFKKKKMIV